jgi:hypothetical protein
MLSLYQIHDILAMLHELFPLQWLARKIAEHIVSGTIFYIELPFIDAVLDLVVTYVNVSGPLT